MEGTSCHAEGTATATDEGQLKLENQLCFPLYAASKEVVRRYKPLLDPLGLTYTQYISMLVLWEYGTSTVGEIGEKLFLDSGTLTPVLVKLEQKGYVTRERSKDDSRQVMISLTPEGKALKERALDVPFRLACTFSSLTKEDAQDLKRILTKLLEGSVDR